VFGTNEAVKAFELDTALEEDTAKEADNILFEPNGPNTFDDVTNDAVKAFELDTALDEETANDEVPNNEPVIPFETVREFKAALEPLIMTFFQLGILKVIMIGYRIACPLPFQVYNI
jgi:hypothetical protein